MAADALRTPTYAHAIAPFDGRDTPIARAALRVGRQAGLHLLLILHTPTLWGQARQARAVLALLPPPSPPPAPLMLTCILE